MSLPSATYDNLGRNTSTEHDLATLGFAVVIDEAYDKLGRRTELAAEIDGTDDLVNSYAYDYLNRMTQVTQGSQAVGNVVAEKRANFSYDAEDKYQFTSISRYADLAGTELVATSTYGYDAADRLTSLTHADGGSSTLAGYTWGYDEGNRLTNFTVYGYSAENATYTYDDTDQLTGADRSGTSEDETYTYDENGNRTGGSYMTGDNNQILSDGTYNYTYDDEGNRVTKTNISTGEVIEYIWDHRNRLVNITTKTSGGTVTHEVDYTYDIFNRRIGKTIDADGDEAGTPTEEIYIYDGLREEQGNAGDHILLAFDESDDLTDRFLYGPNVDQVLASEEVTSTASAGDTLWALTDHLGTVRDVADYNAGTDTTTVQNHLTYDAFGNITAETNAAVDFLFAFTGRERDAESDLQYNRARYYDAAIGKWISEDPLGFGPGDTNLTRYVKGSVTVGLDPSGLDGIYQYAPAYGGSYNGVDPPGPNDKDLFQIIYNWLTGGSINGEPPQDISLEKILSKIPQYRPSGETEINYKWTPIRKYKDTYWDIEYRTQQYATQSIQDGECITTYNTVLEARDVEIMADFTDWEKTNPKWLLLDKYIWNAHHIIDELADISTKIGKEEIDRDMLGVFLGAIHGAIGAPHAISGELLDKKQLHVEDIKSTFESHYRSMLNEREKISETLKNTTHDNKKILRKMDWRKPTEEEAHQCPPE